MISDTISAVLSHVDLVNRDALYQPLTQEGRICGIGVKLSLVHDPPLHVKAEHYSYINIIESIERSSPAERAGLRRDDIIVQVDETQIDCGSSFFLPEEITEMIRGVEGTSVVVVVEREGHRIKYDLLRQPISVPEDKLPETPNASPARKAPLQVTP
ncbi:hypothetical protein THAOC_02777 [Thalassiosira oceanica]|uniref:PDZ domain-containing protein n=1 Tax=Thalassiosira oceanica TaxID=159749 RepID=K0TDG7_THAOC|nr:hypothetical protein THAOC_02777 [Thalassiosira oceanica]|mmetsp:Transcript_26757/g.63445  ORF Transcript_26757/g.63445 Transcript_26757/m.63445 type:complete len:157 (-) Transcript_26757:1081-1551(-)|eukprot:EJK75500.1 hypothetical protein THAOC_02777 [Thalassiosira oceanica]